MTTLTARFPPSDVPVADQDPTPGNREAVVTAGAGLAWCMQFSPLDPATALGPLYPAGPVADLGRVSQSKRVLMITGESQLRDLWNLR